jgi:hypothetical protein
MRSPSVRPLSSAQRHGREGACRRGRNRPRNGRLPLGHRTGGRASVRARWLPPLRRAGGGARRWGTPVASYVAGLPPNARPLDRGKPRDEDTEGGNHPADKSVINRHLSQSCATIASFAGGLLPNGRSTAPHLLTANIRELSGDRPIALAPRSFCFDRRKAPAQNTNSTRYPNSA